MGNTITIKHLKDSDICSSMNKEFLIKLQHDDPSFWEQQKNNKFQFFWLANDNPDVVDINDGSVIEWAPYEREDNIYLEYWYTRYKNGVMVSPQIGEYIIDFKGMLQYHYMDTWKQRPIIRSLPEDVKLIKRKSRFDKNFSFKSFNKTIVDQVEENYWKINKFGHKAKKYEINNKYKEITINFIKSNIKFKIQKYYYSIVKDIFKQNINFITFINELKKEINQISDDLDRFNFYNIDYLNNINEDKFFMNIT